MAFGISAPYPFRTTRAIALILARMKKPAYAGFQIWWPGRDSNPYVRVGVATESRFVCIYAL